jgi:2-hydroxy-6-oxonona-2,4-dienedioate hydrolase
VNEKRIITYVDHNDPQCRAASAAEQRLFAHYGLKYRVHLVEMTESNLSLRVLEVGEGRPLLMVPGGTGDALFLAGLMAELEGWRMIAVNRPGGGMSDGIDHRKINVRSLAVNTLRTVADAFDLAQVPIVCNSMGGLWSFWYVLEHPERVSRMVQLGCPALILDTSAPFFMRLLGVSLINNLIVRKMQPKSVNDALEGLRAQGSSQEDINRMPSVSAEAAYYFFNLPTYRDTWKTLIAAVTTIAGAKFDYRLSANALQQVNCPVQFLWGEKDPFGGLEVARQVADVMPNARLHEMRTGHLPFLDNPQETGRIIREFLQEGV